VLPLVVGGGQKNNSGMRGIHDDQMESRDRQQMLLYMTEHDVGRAVVWNYFRNGWTSVPSRLRTRSAPVARSCMGARAGFCAPGANLAGA